MFLQALQLCLSELFVSDSMMKHKMSCVPYRMCKNITAWHLV